MGKFYKCLPQRAQIILVLSLDFVSESLTIYYKARRGKRTSQLAMSWHHSAGVFVIRREFSPQLLTATIAKKARGRRIPLTLLPIPAQQFSR